MAFVPYHNIDGGNGVTTELIKPGSNVSAIQSIMMANTQGTNVATVTLFLQSNPLTGVPKTFQMLSTVPIPADASLLLDDKALLSFNNSVFGLYITVGSSDTVDVLINT